jgi:hypothetical protein
MLLCRVQQFLNREDEMVEFMTLHRELSLPIVYRLEYRCNGIVLSRSDIDMIDGCRQRNEGDDLPTLPGRFSSSSRNNSTSRG